MPPCVADLAFPVLCVSPVHHVLHCARHADELLVCNARGLRTGFYRGLEIVDRRANRYRVQAAEKTGHAGPWWGFHLLGARTIRVALTLEGLPPLPVAGLKAWLLRALDGMEVYDVHPETKRLVRSEAPWAEVVAQLTHDHYHVF